MKTVVVSMEIAAICGIRGKIGPRPEGFCREPSAFIDDPAQGANGAGGARRSKAGA